MARGKKRVAMDVDSIDASAIAEKLKMKRTNNGTKQTYRSKMNVMIEWLRLHYPSAVQEDTQSIRIPLKTEVVLHFFGHLCRNASICDDAPATAACDAGTTADGGSTDVAVPLSISCVKGYRSALVDLYRSRVMKLDSELDQELKILLDGYDKTINDLKKKGLMKINEGKRYLKSSSYSMLALKLLQQTPETSAQSWSTVVFSWSYFVLMWNLMSRSDSVDTIMLQHVEWSEDCLVIEEQGHKGDQTGSDNFGKHIYANPLDPFKCPVLAVAVLLFCCPNRPQRGRQQLFSGTDNKNRFGKMLRRLLDSLSSDDLNALGCPPEDIGAHSLRKGSSTYALGQVNGPNPVSVFLRMGQSLGKLNDRYIHFGEGADQLCGRMISGLPFHCEKFGILPPHFPHEQLKLMDTRFGTRLCQVLSIGVSPCAGFKATGIPPHLAIARQLKRMADEMANYQNKMDTLKDNLTAALPTIIASKVTDEIRQNFTVDGVVPVSRRDIDNRIATLRDDIGREVRCALQETVLVQPSLTVPEPQVTDHQWRTWTWGDGQICHFVPPQWEFPTRTTVKGMWDLWHFGDRQSGIRPYRTLNNRTDVQKQHHMRYTRAKGTIQFIECIIVELGLLPVGTEKISALHITKSDSVFEQAYQVGIARVYRSKIPRRTEDIPYGRFYNVMCQYQNSID